MQNNETFKTTEKGLIVKIRISPNASKNSISRDGEIIKLKTTAQPIENKANKALCSYLSKQLKIAKSKIQIIKGEVQKDKIISIEGISEQEFTSKLNLN